MKKLILFILAISISFLSFGQQSNSTKLSGIKLEKEQDFSNIPAYVSFFEDHFIDASKMEQIISYLSKDKLIGIIHLDSADDKLNMTHHRYQQSYNNIPIENTQYIFHTKNNKIESMNGCMLSQPDVSGSFSISESTAFQAALDYIKAEKYIFELGPEKQLPGFANYEVPEAIKVYLPENGDPQSNKIRPAYKFDIYAWKPHSRQWIFVDAETGKVVHTENRLFQGDEEGIAHTAYSGVQAITTHNFGNYYSLMEMSRGNGVYTYNCQMTDDYYSAVEFTNETNVWDLANENLDQYATDAHFATEKTYDYYYEVHGRNSIDNAGHELTSFVHFNLVDYGYSNNVNAFWNGSVMTYGDGDDLRTPLTTVDICAHEITHGLTSYTANLVYQNESGALNEAFSDIFGTAVEFYATPSLANWTIGEDIYAPFRSLSNPKEFNLPDTYHGQNWNFGTDDYGGVHRNCGPLCYWFYLISEGSSGTNDNGDSYNVNGIGIDNAADIAFRLLTVYLTNYSNYADARFYGIQAAIDFFGACSYEVEQVTNAFYAIGVGAEYQASVIADFASDFTQNCSTPFTVKFQNSSLNGSSFVWDFGDGTTSTLVNPEHTYNSVGNFTVSLSADGGSCGENQIVKEDYISINPNYPCVTLMPTSGGATSTSCAGTLYDAGGPSLPYYNNTYATFTIKPPGASKIMLTINEFDIEPGSENYCDYDYIAFYDGEYINAPLINNTYYCNTTGNPVSIQSTGGAITIEFNSDPGLTLQGFEIQWICLQDDGIPYPNFSANRISTCDGRIQFENLTVNNVDNYLWDFGDGTTSTYANPYHLYNQSGVYTVSLYVSNAYGENTLVKENYIQVILDDAPEIENPTVCMNEEFTLFAGNNPLTRWYSGELCLDLVHEGPIWEHPEITGSTQYWIKTYENPLSGYVGETKSNQGGGYFGNPSYIHYLLFDSYTPFTIKSVEVNANGQGLRQFALRDASQNLIELKSVYCPNGVRRVNLDIDVPIGTNLQLVGLGDIQLYRTNNANYLNYPYTINGVCSITGSSVNDEPTSYYYYFYNWEVETQACESAYAKMEITTEDCHSSISENSISSIKVFPNPAYNEIQLLGLDNNSIISISDVNGRILLKNLNYINEKINIEHLPSGIYFINISNEKFSHNQKFIKL